MRPASPPGRRHLLAGASLLGASLLGAGLRPAAATPVNVFQRALASGVLRVGVWLNAPPWGGYDQDGAPDGSEVALARLLARDMGLRLQLVPEDPARRGDILLEDRCDVLAAALPILPATLQRFAFTAPHGRVSVVFVAPSRLRLNSFDDLVGKRVAMPAGTYAAEMAHEQLPPGSIALFTPGVTRTVEALLLGQADVAVAFDWQLRDLRLARADLDITAQLTVRSWSYGLTTQLGQHDLLRFLNTFLFLRAADGSLAEIHGRYFGTTMPEGLRFR